MCLWEGEIEHVISLMEAFGCTTSQAFVEPIGCLILQSPTRWQVLTGRHRPPEGWEREHARGSRWMRNRPKVSAGRFFGVRSISGLPRHSPHYRPQLTGLSRDTDAQLCFRQYFLQWPEPWVCLLCRLQTHSLHLLAFFEAGGFDLTRNYPLLGFLASLRDPDAAKNMARMPEEHLLAQVGLQCAHPRVALSIINRLPPEDSDLHAFRCLRALLRAPRALRKLFSLPCVNRDALELLAGDARHYVSDTLLHEVSELGVESRVAQFLNEALCLARRSGRSYFPTITSTDHLMRVYERLRQRVKSDCLNWVFKAPFPGEHGSELWLEPINTAMLAMKVARREHICLASPWMLQKLHAGSLAAYILHAPEKATITLKKGSDGWSPDEIALTGNQGEAKASTWQAVAEWLDRVQGRSSSAANLRRSILRTQITGC